MTLNDLEPQSMGFKWFLAILGCDAQLEMNFRWNILEIDQDNLHTKLNWTDAVARLMSISSDFLYM